MVRCPSLAEFVFNAAGQRVSIWDGGTHAKISGQYYWGGVPIAYYDTSFHFQHQNWQGTERLRTTPSGGTDGAFTSLPFGDAQTTVSGADTDAYHYAGLDHDPEMGNSLSGTDHAQFRQYSDTLGLWMSADPYSGSYDVSNPQSLNRYAYTQDNPLSFTDMSGLEMCDGDACIGDGGGGGDGGWFPGGGGGGPAAPKIIGYRALDQNHILNENLGLPPRNAIADRGSGVDTWIAGRWMRVRSLRRGTF